MKATGIVRRVDDLGRVVIPKELRRTQGIKEGDPMEIFVTSQGIVFRKYVPGCFLCGNLVDLALVNGRDICLSCRTSASRTVK
ncbi:AbrB family transcriptional regulator [Paenibacillus selenitireducens]|uniref:AbrB family transcriptional regulator n=1 Tax=Paenibacillus selenitireducens TaxID=1324314 RepID=A0A1T2X9R5_9BACL|nr:AbrB/MazE/SpoVT family DNA-binding domain-containing protein [Paenibacillus selenitireducens]OPA76647.1 AbrB family transcriptional regulator [Paenibacillus selenitireducens]